MAAKLAASSDKPTGQLHANPSPVQHKALSFSCTLPSAQIFCKRNLHGTPTVTGRQMGQVGQCNSAKDSDYSCRMVRCMFVPQKQQRLRGISMSASSKLIE